MLQLVGCSDPKKRTYWLIMLMRRVTFFFFFFGVASAGPSTGPLCFGAVGAVELPAFFVSCASSASKDDSSQPAMLIGIKIGTQNNNTLSQLLHTYPVLRPAPTFLIHTRARTAAQRLRIEPKLVKYCTIKYYVRKIQHPRILGKHEIQYVIVLGFPFKQKISLIQYLQASTFELVEPPGARRLSRGQEFMPTQYFIPIPGYSRLTLPFLLTKLLLLCRSCAIYRNGHRLPRRLGSSGGVYKTAQ